MSDYVPPVRLAGPALVTLLDEVIADEYMERMAQMTPEQRQIYSHCRLILARPWPTDHESDCPAYQRPDMDNRTVLVECTCPMGNL